MDVIQAKHELKFVVQQSRVTKLKYCYTCQIYRPPRAIHCDDCGCCIMRLDHHCPWLGTCVGQRNYRFFLVFVNTLALMIIYMVIWSFVLFDIKANQCMDKGRMKQHQCWNEAVKTHWVVLGLVVYSIIFSFFVFLLCGYHHYLLFLNNTTNEHIKGTYKLLGNPFRRNWGVHLSSICSSKTLKRFWDNNRLAKSEEEAEYQFNKNNVHFFFSKWGLVEEMICEEFKNKTSTRETRKTKEEVVDVAKFGIGQEQIILGPKDDSCMIFEGDSSYKKADRRGENIREIIYE